MIFKCAILQAAVLWIGLICTPLCCQQKSEVTQGESLFVDGVVVSRQKYSFTLQGPDKQYEFGLNPLTRISARLIRPKIDWTKRKATVTIPMSAPDGRAVNNQVIHYQLPEELYFRNRFANRSSLEIALTRSPMELKDLTLTPVMDQNVDALSLAGPLSSTGELNVFQTRIQGQKKLVRPSLNVVRLDGFTIMELKPLATEVFVNYGVEDGKLIARNIEFVRLADRSKATDRKLPRCLIIGDSVSFNYFAALHRFLRPEVNLFHPHANCQGSENQTKLHRWLGVYQAPNQQWDVIAFNFGHADAEMSKMDYQDNLSLAIEKLKATGAKLIWVESTPVPFGFNDSDLEPDAVIPNEKRFDFEFEEANAMSLLPGRMRLQNKWAEEVLKSHPGIKICKTWLVVKENRRGAFTEWWFGKNLNFKNQQAQQIAAELAKTIRAVLK